MTLARLSGVERAEAGLRALGFGEVRVRHYGDTARLEVPFDRLAETHRDLVCRANLAFMEGLLEGGRHGGLRAVLEPRLGRCCVAFVG